MYQERAAAFQIFACMMNCTTCLKKLDCFIGNINCKVLEQLILCNTISLVISKPCNKFFRKMMDIDHKAIHQRTAIRTLCLSYLCHHVLNQRFAGHWNQSFRQSVGYRFQTGAKSRCKYHRFHNLQSILQIPYSALGEKEQCEYQGILHGGDEQDSLRSRLSGAGLRCSRS